MHPRPSKTIRVLMISRLPYAVLGGAQKQAVKLAHHLIQRDVKVQIVTGWWHWGTPQRQVIDGVSIFQNFTCWEMFGIKGLRKFGSYLYLLTLFWHLWRQRNEYNVIHIHLLSHHAFPSVLAGRWLKKKTIIKLANSGSGGDIYQMQYHSQLPGSKYMLPVILKADRFVAINRAIIDELRAAGVAPERIVTIPNGVEVDQFAPKTDYSVDHNEVSLIFVGRLHPQKGLDILLPAFRQVIACQSGTGWRLLLVGAGPSQHELEKMAQQLGIEQHVQFVGSVDNVASYLAQADLFVLPSRAEGMSNALLEAMATGLPCIASRISGNIDLVQHEENGLLVPPEDIEALTGAVIRLAEDVSLRTRLGRAARRTVEADYSLDGVASRYIELYDTLLN